MIRYKQLKNKAHFNLHSTTISIHGRTFISRTKKHHYYQWLKLDQFYVKAGLIGLIEEGMREGSIRKIQIPFLLKCI